MSSFQQFKVQYEVSKYRQLFTESETNSLPQTSHVRDTLDDLVELTIARTTAQCAFITLTDGTHHQVLSSGHKQDITSSSNQFLDIEFSSFGKPNGDWTECTWLLRQTIAVDTSTDVASDRTFVVPDLTQNENTISSSFASVCDTPTAFYAGAPIQSTSGLNIGAVSILAGSDRTELSAADIDALTKAAKRCANLLELAREKGYNDRWSRTERELDSFISTRCPQTLMLQDEPAMKSSGPGKLDSNNTAEGPFTGLSYPMVEGEETKRVVEAEAERDARISNDEQDVTRHAHESELESDGDHSEGRAYRRVFKRAAKSLQKSFEADGVIFVDGHSAFHGALQPVAESSMELGREASGASPAQRSANRNNRNHRGQSERIYSSPEYRKGTELNYPAEVLGSFIQTIGPKTKQLPYATHALCTINERQLQVLMDNFPRGAVWYKEDSTVARVKEGTLVEEEQSIIKECLLETFPFARQIILKSLVDPTSLKRLAVCFVWRNETQPIYTDKVDLPSLIEFLHVVESEVARYDAAAVVKQQGAFVSSVSHELRTPLHGILGAVQLLGDTNLDPLQQSLLQTINSCGSTLHDTLTSVLSYAQINQFERRQHQHRQQTPQNSEWALADKHAFVPGPDRHYKNLYIKTNLAMLCEEIVGVLDAEQSFYRSDDGEGVLVVVNIEYQENWCFDTEPGALRRIAANLIGNALKYTTNGTVIITLQCQQIIADKEVISNDLSTGRTIKLEIEDTGKGISKNFLENHLFNPFTQEDATSSQGVGLGMSIVKSLVSLLSGQIQVRSEVGVGSNFAVCIPMEMSQIKSTEEQTPTTDLDSMIAHVRSRNLRIMVFGFPDVIRQSIETYLRDWCHCSMIAATDDARPHIVIFDECNEGIREEVESSGQKYGECAVLLSIVLNPKKLAMPMKTIEGYTKWNRIPRPLGPNSVATGLLACVAKLDGISGQNDDESSNKHDEEEPTDNNLQNKHVERSLASVESTSILEQSTKDSERIAPSHQHMHVHDETTKEQRRRSNASAHISQEPFPLRPKRTSTFPLTSSSSRPPPSELNILLVDDNALNLRLLKAFLTKNGYHQTQPAENGAIAVDAVRNTGGGFDIIFMDLSMPVLSGFDATRQIRELEASRQDHTRPHPAIIIALTGLASVKDHEDAFSAGVDMFLTKPMNFAELGAALRKCEGWVVNGREAIGRKE